MELQDKYLPRDLGAAEGWRLLNIVWGWRVDVPAPGPGAYVKYYCTTPGMICTPRMMASPWPENPFRLRTQRLQRPP
jgi:hypothetical protein